jgi:hypothetical protein
MSVVSLQRWHVGHPAEHGIGQVPSAVHPGPLAHAGPQLAPQTGSGPHVRPLQSGSQHAPLRHTRLPPQLSKSATFAHAPARHS